jgi:CRISPR/Cas system-associated exonuclease Cas4 (RecB family)
MSVDVKEKFFSAVMKELEDGSRKNNIHVTELVYDCLRRGYYTHLHGEMYDLEGAMRMWIGKKLHETSVLGGLNEVELQWQNIWGRVDEYDPNTKTLLEKKTTRQIPKNPYDHHVKQLNYYRVLLENNGYQVQRGLLLYVDVTTPAIEVFDVLLADRKMVEQEMLAKYQILSEALAKQVPPPRATGWLCDYCPWVGRCFRE